MTLLRTIARSAVVAAISVAAIVPAIAGGGATDIGAYRWTNVRPTVPFDPTLWAPRAGLQALEFRNDLYVMGGRGPFSFETETVLFGDVWKSTDVGATWQRVAQWQPGQVAAGMWSPRAYFGAVTHRGRLFVIGGQHFETKPNPLDPSGCALLPPGVPCLPFLPDSTFFDDVWSIKTGLHRLRRQRMRRGQAAPVCRLSFTTGPSTSWVAAGATMPRPAVRAGSCSTTSGCRADGRTWTEVTGQGPRWAPRAGAAVVSKDGYIYLLGGERGFTCGFNPQDPCQPATRTLYFNDVSRSKDGASWKLVTPAAGWSPRPGHQCVELLNQIVCFGGYGEVPGQPFPANPTDMWTSRDGKTWTELKAPAAPPWNGRSPADMRYDFDALVVPSGRFALLPAILTFGGDRERFELPHDVNASRPSGIAGLVSSLGRRPRPIR